MSAKLLSSLLLLLGFTFPVISQKKLLLEAKVRAATANDNVVIQAGSIVFTGSSTIERWEGLAGHFPLTNVINNGIGGSEMSDILAYSQTLITDYKPVKVFIYEGDNDIASGKTSDEILGAALAIVNNIRSSSETEVPIYFITAKPSPLRWHMQKKYISYNLALKEWANNLPNVFVIDIWKPMLNEFGEVRISLFKKDKLHMNAKGYRVWAECLKPYLLVASYK